MLLKTKEIDIQYYLQRFFWFSLAVSFIMASFFIGNLILKIHATRSDIESQSRTIHEHALVQIQKQLEHVEQIAQTFEQHVIEQILPGTPKFNKKKLEGLIKHLAKEYPGILGLGIAFNPAYLKQHGMQKLYAPYLITSKNNVLEYIQKQYDYTKRAWYQHIFESPKGLWLDPYYGTVSNSLLAEYGIPVYSDMFNNKQTPLAVIFVNYSLKNIKEFITQLSLGETGYSFMISENGKFLAYPINNYVKKQVHIKEVIKQKKQDAAIAIALHALSKPSGSQWIFDKKMGKNIYAVFSTLKSSHWRFITLFIQSQLIGFSSPQVRNSVIATIASILLFLSFLVIILTHVVYADDRYRFWLCSIIISLLLIAGIITIWFLQITYSPAAQKQYYSTTNPITKQGIDRQKIITEKPELAQLIDSIELKNGQDLSVMPIGVYVRHVILNRSTINFAGYIWQKYKETHSQGSEDFSILLPDASEISETKIHELKKKHFSLVSWNITATLNNAFDYARYPFDTQEISIQIKPKNYKNYSMFIPDLDAYSYLNPSLLPGIMPELTLPGWTIEKSYFSFQEPVKDNNFEKLSAYISEKYIPQLFYNIIVKRNFWDPFITYIAPLLLACFFLFMMLLIASRQKVWEPLGLLSGLFFGVVLTHLNLRNNFSMGTIVYLEYFFIAVYVIMLLTILTIFLIATDNKAKIIQYKEGLLPKIIYWPALLSLWFIITAIYFIY